MIIIYFYDDKNDDDDNDGSADCIGLMILIITEMMITMLIIKTIVFTRFVCTSHSHHIIHLIIIHRLLVFACMLIGLYKMDDAKMSMHDLTSSSS
jgi:hypothetical protein